MRSFWKRLRQQFNPHSLSKGVKVFAMSVGATAVCMLASLSFLKLEPSRGTALEASAFNGGREFLSPQAAQTSVGQGSQESPGKVVPLGTVFGIKLFTDGVIVASLSDLYTSNGVCCPAAEAGILPGDYLLEADGMEIPSNQSLAEYIGQSAGEAITFQVRRGEQVFETQVTPVYGEGSFKTGMWVRDSAAGIGTLTFYDPSTGCFAGLGHGICDMDTSGVMTLKTGEPMPITLSGVIKGKADAPGQLQGYFSSEEPLEILPKEQVRCGPVQLLVSLDETGPQLYEGEIVQIANADQLTKNLVVRVTDSRLLQATGGIVQGMSGCPILQDGKLAGAVTHVFTEDPTTGYGIFAQVMWEECQSCQGTG